MSIKLSDQHVPVAKMRPREYIKIRGAAEHNLKNLDVDIPRNELVVLTGLSGSGKSSLAFDTIYAEGQRRYMESLSSYARQFLGQMEKPNVEKIEGLSPAISIDQKSTNRNPRSTVGTVTEIYDYFRLLYARIGIPHCPNCGKEIRKQTVDQMVDQIMELPEGTKIQLLWGQMYITDYIGNVKYQISPLSFYQVNPVQTEKLYGLALEYADLKGDETVWDLYCGIGTISLFLAQKAKQVYGVEIVPQAIDDAKENAKINAIDNAEFFVGKAEEVLPEYYAEYEREHNGETAHADVIVVDPPRKGCDETLLETIVKMQPEKVVYVSCDSATLARDLKYLCANGYEIKMCRGVDQFPQSVHVETCVLLSKLGQ